jgi:hypothetical protein
MSTTLKLPLAALKLNVDLTGLNSPHYPAPGTILGQQRAQTALGSALPCPAPANILSWVGRDWADLSMITHHLDALHNRSRRRLLMLMW